MVRARAFKTRCDSRLKVKRLIEGSRKCSHISSGSWQLTGIGLPFASRRCTMPKLPRSIVERKKRVTLTSREYCTEAVSGEKPERLYWRKRGSKNSKRNN